MQLRNPRRSVVGLLLAFAAVSLAVVSAVGLVLAHAYRDEAAQRGLAEGAAEAALVATTAVQPLFDGASLSAGPDPVMLPRLAAITQAADGVARLRIRDLDGRLVYASDGSGLGGRPDDKIRQVLRGATLVSLTRLSSDQNSVGPVGLEVVAVYRPLLAGTGHVQVGVLEIYLPYAPIQRDVEAGLSDLFRNLVIGLCVLYIAIAALLLATTRRLRQQVAANAYLAEHDTLTGLPNRRLFQRTVAEATARGGQGVVALIDLDRFKEVNDSLGHQRGDVLLTVLGGRLAAEVRPGDLVARLGGDEFGVVLARVVTEAEAHTALGRLSALLSDPVEIDGLPLTAEASIGFAMFPDDGLDPDTLLQRADIAMYAAKAAHSGIVRFDEVQNVFDPQRLAVVGELRRALRDDELVLHFQPKVRLADGVVTAVEALIRWQHPQRGLLSPDEFLPVAEQTGLIHPLTEWVIDTALDHAAVWSAAGRVLPVAVNVSARNVCRPGFAEQVLAQVRAKGAVPSMLIIEVTETAVLTDVERATANLRLLAAEGILVSLDDFGQGQTSLGHLSRLPLFELKIDQAFVSNMDTEAADAAIVRSLIDLAHDLGFVVVAEGVERAAIRDALRALGCDDAQGSLLCRAQSFDAVTLWLTAQPVATAP